MPSSRQPGGITKRGRSRFSFITETISELKKVTWLTRREAAYLTLLVLLAAATVGAALGLIDLGFSGIINLILGK